MYRVELALGLLDHLTLGVTAHWLPGQRAPGWSPKVAVAFFRGRWIEVGASYHQLLYPPTRPTMTEMPVEDEAMTATTTGFQRRAHHAFAHVSLSQAWFTAGLDLGWARGRDPQALLTSDDLLGGRYYTVHDRLGGGLHLRLGTRRIGATLQVTYPYTSVELALDLRFGLFELRQRGGWREL